MLQEHEEGNLIGLLRLACKLRHKLFVSKIFVYYLDHGLLWESDLWKKLWKRRGCATIFRDPKSIAEELLWWDRNTTAKHWIFPVHVFLAEVSREVLCCSVTAFLAYTSVLILVPISFIYVGMHVCMYASLAFNRLCCSRTAASRCSAGVLMKCERVQTAFQRKSVC